MKATKKKVVITRNLYKQISATPRTEQSILYLLGKNKKDVFTHAIRLHNGGSGCYNLPGVPRTTLAKAYIELVKKNLTPAGFSHNLRPEINRFSGFSAYPYAEMKYKFPGNVFILFNPGPRVYISGGTRKEDRQAQLEIK